MRSEEAEKAISRIQYLIKVSKETMYNIALSDYDIEKIEILLNYIEELEERKDTKKELIDKIIESTQLVSKDGENFEFKEVK